MIKIFVDSGSSIKQDEKERYGVEILPLQIMLGDRSYIDGVDLSMDVFYHALIVEKQFPKTSLPALGEVEARVLSCVEAGDDVIILTISSGISGTYGAFKALFADQPKVHVIDTKTAVGGIRILVQEANKYLDQPVELVVERIMSLIPRIRVIAIPETLEYLHRGGRLKKTAFLVGSLLQIKPLITLDNGDGSVKVLGKARGMRNAIEALANALAEYGCDTEYPIVPSYTYSATNVDTLIAATADVYKAQMIEYDHLDPAIACHWGPNAFGYIFVTK